MQIVNQTSSPITYSVTGVTVPANASVTLTNYQICLAVQDSALSSDLNLGNSVISDGYSNYAGGSAVQYLLTLADIVTNIDKTGSGSITAAQPTINTPVANATVVANTNRCSNAVFNITGTWSATLNIDAHNGDGFWFPVPGVNPANGNQFSAFLNNLQVIIPCGGYAQVRIRCSSYTSGTVNVTYNASLGDSYINQGAAGSLPSAWPFKLTESTGTYTVNVDPRGAQYITPLDGPRATYSAAVSLTAAASATDVFTITGSSTKTIRINEIRITMGASLTAESQNISLIRRSAANSGGTSASATAVTHDTNNAAATASVTSYTANPSSLGASVGNMRIERAEATTSGGSAVTALLWQFGDGPSQCPVLRGTSQILAINLGGTSPSTIQIAIEWTEE